MNLSDVCVCVCVCVMVFDVCGVFDGVWCLDDHIGVQHAYHIDCRSSRPNFLWVQCCVCVCVCARARVCVIVSDGVQHAYYIDHRNSRPNFLAAFWKLANWSFASENYAARARPRL